MRIIILLCVCTMLFGCNLRANKLAQYQGQHINVLIADRGIPTDILNLGTQKVYIWAQGGNTSYRRGVGGGISAVVVGCTERVLVDANEIIRKVEAQSSGGMICF